MIVLALYILIIILTGYIAYQDYKTTIVPSYLVFILLFLTILLNIFVFPISWPKNIISFILAIVFIGACIYLYRKLNNKTLFPMVFLSLSCILGIIDVVFLHCFYYILLMSFAAFAVLLYYLKFWAEGDLYIFVAFCMFLLTFFPFSCKYPFIVKIFKTVPLQILALVIVTLSYVPYIVFVSVCELVKKNKISKKDIILSLYISLIPGFITLLIYTRFLKTLPGGFYLSLIVFIILTQIFQRILRKIEHKTLHIVLGVVLVILGILCFKTVGLLMIKVLFLVLAGIFLLIALVALKSESGKSYVRIEDLCDADIPLFYILKIGDKYVYTESLDKFKDKNFKIIIKKKSADGLYPSDIRLINEIKNETFPEYVPIAKGIPLVPAFFVAMIAIFIFFRFL